MRIDVLFGAASVASADVAGRVVAVIDVLRASTTIATALSHGARAVIPLDSPDDVVTRAKAFERRDVRLAGERKMLRIPGFDLGNSPSEFTREAVEGKTVLITTTNGTPAIANTQGARDVVIASYVNYTAVLTMLRTALRGGTDIAIICAGRDRQFALEDGGLRRSLREQRVEADVRHGAQRRRAGLRPARSKVRRPGATAVRGLRARPSASRCRVWQ